MEALGAKLEVQADKLRVIAPRGALGESDIAALAGRRAELLVLVRRRARRRLERFLAEASIPAAVFHSEGLGRAFVLVRDGTALEALTRSERAIPVLTFADCEKLAGLRAADMSAILDVREAFGPAAELVAVRPRVG